MKEPKRISADEEERYRALARERALSDAVNDCNAAQREGLEEGRLEGEATVMERLLTRRFGPLDEANVAGSGEPAQNSWYAGRIVSSTLRRRPPPSRALRLPMLEASVRLRGDRSQRIVDRASRDPGAAALDVKPVS